MLVRYSDCFVCGKSGDGETLRFGETEVRRDGKTTRCCVAVYGEEWRKDAAVVAVRCRWKECCIGETRERRRLTREFSVIIKNK
jgi:hypothetical protein